MSYTELIANPVAYADPAKRQAMEQLQTLLSGALEARGKVLVKLNVDEADLDAVIALLPALKSPTVSKLFGDDGYAVETVVPKSEINMLIPALKDARRHRHPRAADLQDRPLMTRWQRCAGDASSPSSTSDRGLGEITRRRRRRATRSTAPQIADGTRTIAVGTAVAFEVVAGHLGRWEAAASAPRL